MDYAYSVEIIKGGENTVAARTWGYDDALEALETAFRDEEQRLLETGYNFVEVRELFGEEGPGYEILDVSSVPISMIRIVESPCS